MTDLLSVREAAERVQAWLEIAVENELITAARASDLRLLLAAVGGDADHGGDVKRIDPEQAALALGAWRERERIVAWLRAHPLDLLGVEQAADEIERGEHVTAVPPVVAPENQQQEESNGGDVRPLWICPRCKVGQADDVIRRGGPFRWVCPTCEAALHPDPLGPRYRREPDPVGAPVVAVGEDEQQNGGSVRCENGDLCGEDHDIASMHKVGPRVSREEQQERTGEAQRWAEAFQQETRLTSFLAGLLFKARARCTCFVPLRFYVAGAVDVVA